MPTTMRSGTTVASGVIAIVLAALWCLAGIFFVIAGLALNAATDDAPEWAEDLDDAFTAVFLGIAVVILACSIWSIVAGANLIRRRPWARIATIVTFSIWSVLAALSFIGSLTGGDSGESDGGGIGVTLIWLSACLAVVILAALRSTKEDVESATGTRNGIADMPAPYGGGPPYGGPPGPGAPPPGPPPPRFS